MSQEMLLDRIEFRLAHNAELAKGFAKLRADNKALLDVVRDYREAEDHAFCDPAGACGMDGRPTRDVRCPICKKADELIEHSEPQ